MHVHVGVDVGGTNTDAVVVCNDDVIGWAKRVTTDDVTTGVVNAITGALNDAKQKNPESDFLIFRVVIGTTHFVNAIVQKRHLAKISIIRLGGPATSAMPPFIEFPADLKQVIYGSTYMASGGYEFNGKDEISELNKDELRSAVEEIRKSGIKNVVISGVFCSVNSRHEEQVEAWINEWYPECSVTASHTVGQLGILERENAAVLNECLKPLARHTIDAFRSALDNLGLTCPFYLSQNDGTLLGAEDSLRLPVHTFASGPTNSMRGAAFLAEVRDAVVVDIGGTTTDVGIIVHGFPRQASTKVKVANVRTNFQMPDVVSIGLGGGSIVRLKSDTRKKTTVGPDSVGNKLEREALIFGGKTHLTTSDVAVAAGLVEMGDAAHVQHLSKDVIDDVLDVIHEMVANAIDRVKISKEDVPVILVGGGCILVDIKRTLEGTSHAFKPNHFQVANAVGAAFGQVLGVVDRTIAISDETRPGIIADAKQQAINKAIAAGAVPDTVKITEVSDVPLPYLPGNATHLIVKAVGEFQHDPSASKGVRWSEHAEIEPEVGEGVQQVTAQSAAVDDGSLLDVTETEPTIDPTSGEWILSEWDVECIALGAGMLGCGGGGNPDCGRLRARRAIRQGKKIRVVTPERFLPQMGADSRVMIVAFLGTPTVLVERVPNSQEAKNAIRASDHLYSIANYKEGGSLDDIVGQEIKKEETLTYIPEYKLYEGEKVDPNFEVVATCAVEIGGLNSVEPLLTGAELDLPCIDGDFMGRAFPELQMTTLTINKIAIEPISMASFRGQETVLLEAKTHKHIEDHFRHVVFTTMGGIGSVCLRPIDKEEVRRAMVPHSISRAWRLGRAVLRARKQKHSCVDAIVKIEGGKVLCIGKIADVSRRVEAGFTRGECLVEGTGDHKGEFLRLHFQNEYLIAKDESVSGESKTVAIVPDLIITVDEETGETITTDDIRYGMRVAIMAVGAPPQLCTDDAARWVGPPSFGYPNEKWEHSLKMVPTVPVGLV